MHIYTIKKLLNIQEYKVTEIISTNSKEIHIRLEAYKRKKAICSGCGEVHEVGYHSSKEVVVEDLPISQRRVYLHVRKRRYRCPQDGRIRTEDIVWLKLKARVTNRFAEYVNRLTAITTNQEAGWFLGLNDEVVYRIDKEILEEKAKEKLDPPPAGVHISVDEVSYRKYHRYRTNVIDVDRKLVVWNDKGRKAEVLDRYYEGIGEGNRKKIESVALDGAKHYISSTNKYAVNALIVYDRFHVRRIQIRIIQKLNPSTMLRVDSERSRRVNRAVDTVRKQELRKARADKNEELIELMNCRQRFILLKNKGNLREKEAEYLKRLCEINQPIYPRLWRGLKRASCRFILMTT